MAKTITQLTDLAAMPADSDVFMLDAGGVTKKVSAANVKFDCLRVISSTVTVGNSVNFALNTAAGTKIGTDTTQKLGFYNATPVTQRPDELDVGAGVLVDELVADGVAVGVGVCDAHSSPTWNDAPHTCGSCRVSRYVQSKSTTPAVVVAVSSVTELTRTSPSGEHSYVTKVSRGTLRRQLLVSP